MVLFLIYPGMKKKTSINAHELEALRFLLTCYELTENTTIGAGQGGRVEQGAGQSRGQGRVHALRLRLAACLHPRALRASTPGSSARGRAQRQRTSRLLGADSHSKVQNLLQTGASSVCVCVRARKHVGTNFIPALTHTVIICVCVMYVCM